MKMKFTVFDFQRCKDEGKKFAMVCTYDYTMASIINESDVEAILVGDSVGMIVQGLEGTVPVTMDQMIYHTKCVVRGAPDTFIVGDMPFGSYNVSCEQAVINANRLMKEEVICVKLEYGVEVADKTKPSLGRYSRNGPYGLTPQTAAALEGLSKGRASKA